MSEKGYWNKAGAQTVWICCDGSNKDPTSILLLNCAARRRHTSPFIFVSVFKKKCIYIYILLSMGILFIIIIRLYFTFIMVA